MNYNVNWNLIRVLMILCGTILGVLGLVLGFLLIQQGATGKFEVLGEAKGFKIFLTSVSPGVFIALVGGSLAGLAFKMQKHCLGLPDSKQLKARGGPEYYKLLNNNDK
jgi:hypothetical protein